MRSSCATSLTLLCLSLSACGDLGDGGPAGVWWFRLTKTASCTDGGPTEYHTEAKVSPVQADERRLHIRFGNQEWQVTVNPNGNIGEWHDGKAITTVFGGRFAGDSFEGELVFEPLGENCKNAYAIDGQKILDYPS